jgi:hypothetical protein
MGCGGERLRGAEPDERRVDAPPPPATYAFYLALVADTPELFSVLFDPAFIAFSSYGPPLEEESSGAFERRVSRVPRGQHP